MAGTNALAPISLLDSDDDDDDKSKGGDKSLAQDDAGKKTTTNSQRKRKKRPTSNNELSSNFVTPTSRKTPSLGRNRRNESSLAEHSPLAQREPGAKYQYDEALRHLRHMPIHEEDIKWVLQATEPPYDLNEMVHRIRTKNHDDVEQSPEFEELNPWATPFVGMRVRKKFENDMHCGTVMYRHKLDSEEL